MTRFPTFAFSLSFMVLGEPQKLMENNYLFATCSTEGMVSAAENGLLWEHVPADICMPRPTPPHAHSQPSKQWLGPVR